MESWSWAVDSARTRITAIYRRQGAAIRLVRTRSDVHPAAALVSWSDPASGSAFLQEISSRVRFPLKGGPGPDSAAAVLQCGPPRSLCDCRQGYTRLHEPRPQSAIASQRIMFPDKHRLVLENGSGQWTISKIEKFLLYRILVDVRFFRFRQVLCSIQLLIDETKSSHTAPHPQKSEVCSAHAQRSQ
jgi:hypothetical protein